MRADFLKTFRGDLDNINQKTAKEGVVKIINLVERVESIWEIPHVKKLT